MLKIKVSTKGVPVYYFKECTNNLYVFTNPNNIRIWMGGWFQRNGLFRFPVRKRSIHPEMLFFIISMNYCFILKLTNFPSSYKCEFSIAKLSSGIKAY